MSESIDIPSTPCEVSSCGQTTESHSWLEVHTKTLCPLTYLKDLRAQGRDVIPLSVTTLSYKGQTFGKYVIVYRKEPPLHERKITEQERFYESREIYVLTYSRHWHWKPSLQHYIRRSNASSVYLASRTIEAEIAFDVRCMSRCMMPYSGGPAQEEALLGMAYPADMALPPRMDEAWLTMFMNTHAGIDREEVTDDHARATWLAREWRGDICREDEVPLSVWERTHREKGVSIWNYDDNWVMVKRIPIHIVKGARSHE